MDIASVVNDSAFIAACFALLAYIGLSVELGPRPTIKSDADKGSGSDGKSEGHARGTQPQREVKSTGERSKVKSTSERRRIKSTSDRSNAVNDVADSLMAVIELQTACVDGHLGPRTKYDVALAMLSEVQSMPEKDAAENMAIEAYNIAGSHPKFGKYIIRSNRRLRPVGKRDSFSPRDSFSEKHRPISSYEPKETDEWRA